MGYIRRDVDVSKGNRGETLRSLVTSRMLEDPSPPRRVLDAVKQGIR